LLDLVNCIELPYGCYIKTDCIKWVKRFGPNLRPLAPGEQPKPTFLLKEVTNTVEDKVKEDVVVEPTPEVVEVKAEPTLAESGKKVPKRRKLSV
jgi:hypothetical protein